MRNVIYKCGQSGHFFLNLSTFSKRNFNFQKGASTCAPFYYKMKGKREQKRSWKCLSKKNWNSPCNVQGKAFFKKIRWSEISKLFSFFFLSTLRNWHPPQIFFKNFDLIYNWNISWTTIPGTAIITENVRSLLLELQKFSNYNLEA